MGKLIGRIPNWLRVVLFFILFSLAARWISTITAPAQYAGRNDCLTRENDAGPYTNSCDKPINARYCFRTTGLEKTCGVVELAPGETMSDLRAEADAARENHAVYRTTVHACAVPYIPQDVPSNQNTARMVDGCRKPPKPDTAG